MDLVLNERILTISLAKYLLLDIDRVFLHLESGVNICLMAAEVPLARDEAYTLYAHAASGVEGTEVVKAGWRVGFLEIIQRQEWIEVVEGNEKFVGDRPRIHRWGPVGSVPQTSQHSIVTDFAWVLRSVDGQFQAMVHISDYPGLVCFTTDALEISSLSDFYSSGYII